MATVLGIETSCDETGVVIVRDGVLLGDALASSMDEHARFGGIIPEIAAPTLRRSQSCRGPPSTVPESPWANSTPWQPPQPASRIARR